MALDVSEAWLIAGDKKTPAADRVETAKQRLFRMIESTNEESDLMAIEDVIAAIIKSRSRDAESRK